MIVVSNAPLFSPACTGVVRMGDPTPSTEDPSYVVMEFPYPTPEGGTKTFASWPPGATEWQSRSTEDDSCRFQISANKTVLEAERSGPVVWMMQGGLF